MDVQPDPPTLRPAKLGDEHAIAELNALVQKLHVDGGPAGRFELPRSTDVAAWFRAKLQSETSWVWLAEDGRRAVGYLLATRRVRAENPFSPRRRWIEIDHVVVLPEARRRGIARRLLGEARTLAEEHGIEELELSTWSFNTEAQQAFRRLGFSPIQIRFGQAVDGRS